MHFMPWEIDYAITSFSQLNKSYYYLSDTKNIKIYTLLNLSNYAIDWELSKIPKEYFIEKYNVLLQLLNKYECISKIYDGDNKYGHLNLQRSVYEEYADYYVGICPDIYFSEYTLFYMIESAKKIKNKYFYVTPEICTLWDKSWDVITNKKIGILDYTYWNTRDIFDIDFYLHSANESVILEKTYPLKWAGWFDVYNRAFVEEFGGIFDDWHGYGAWDLYTMNVCEIAKKMGYDFQQYLLKGQIIFPYSHETSPFKKSDGMVSYYKNNLHIKKHESQLEIFNQNLPYYINKKINDLSKP